jgi:hypothetical protein
MISKKWQVELLSIVFIAGICGLILLPVYIQAGNLYRFYVENAISIFVFLSFTKYIFLLEYLPYSRNRWFKFAGIFLAIPVFLYLINSLYDFQRFLDEEGIASVLLHTQNMDNYDFGKFIRYQYLLFNTGALVCTALLPVRMIVSFWRIYNTKDQV